MEAMELESSAYQKMVVDDGDVRKIVLDYLVHGCLKETAEAFVSCMGLEPSFNWSTLLDMSKTIYTHALEGNALRAIQLTNEVAPDLLRNHKDVLFDLLTLHFVELIRAKNSTGALEFAQRELMSYGKLDQCIEKLQDCMTLLAYDEPEKSPVFELLGMDHRQSVADKLNQAVLAYHKLPVCSVLERLLQQLTLVKCCLTKEGYSGSLFVGKLCGDLE